MKIPHIELFRWLQNKDRAKFVLSSSQMKGLSKHEYDKLISVGIGPEFDLGQGNQSGALEFNEVLMEMYGCKLENIVTAAGGTAANFLVFLSILDKGDEFIIEQPGYQPMWVTPEMLGARKIVWKRQFANGFKLDIEALEGLITDRTKLIMLTNPHNPTGVVADREFELKRLAGIAKAHGIYILIDEIFLDGAFSRQHSSYGLPNVIITSSMTKIYGLGGQRTGWIIAPPEIASECQCAKTHSNASSSYVGEIMNARALRDARKHLMKKYNHLSMSNFRFLSAWMEGNQDIVEWVVPQGGIMCFPKYKAQHSSIALCNKLLDDHEVMVVPGEYFGLDGHIRLSYACSEDALKSSLRALRDGLQELS